MFSTLVFGAALAAPAAPIPKDTNPAPTGPAPWVVYLKGDAGGNVGLTVVTYQKVKQIRGVVTIENGKQVVKNVEQEINQPSHAYHQLNTLPAKFTTAGGTALAAAEVVKRAKDGVVVLVSADGKPVEKAWLRAIDPDAVVVTADALAKAVMPPMPTVPVPTAAPRLVLLGTDASGKVQVSFNPNGGAAGGGVAFNKFGRMNGRAVFVNNGQAVQQFFQADEGVAAAPTDVSAVAPLKALEDVKFDAYDLTGKAVSREAAVARLKAGGLVLVAGDTRVPDAAFLKLFRGDLLVLVSPELLNVPNGNRDVLIDVIVAPGGGGVRPLPIRIRPAPPIQAVPLPAQILPVKPVKALPQPLPAEVPEQPILLPPVPLEDK